MLCQSLGLDPRKDPATVSALPEGYTFDRYWHLAFNMATYPKTLGQPGHGEH
jgi:hypothetical protein